MSKRLEISIHEVYIHSSYLHTPLLSSSRSFSLPPDNNMSAIDRRYVSPQQLTLSITWCANASGVESMYSVNKRLHALINHITTL